MLILTRKLGESITIGDDIKVSVLGIHGRQVRLGIDAPSDVVVHREEVYVRIQAENRRAQKSLKDDLLNMVGAIKGKIKGDQTGRARPPEIEYKEDERRRRHPRRRNDDDRPSKS